MRTTHPRRRGLPVALCLAILAAGNRGPGLRDPGGCRLPAIASPSRGLPPIEAGTAPRGREFLRFRADIPLPGGTSRFDYQSVDTSGRRLYLSHMGAGQLIVFDTDSSRVRAVVGGVPGVTGVWAVPELQRVYASATGLHQLAIVDTRTLGVVAHAGPIGFPDGIAYAPGVQKVFVSDESRGQELVVDAPHDRAAGVIAVGGEAGNTIYDAGSGCILVAVQTRNDVVAIDPASNRVIGRYAFPGLDHPHGMSVDAAGRLLFIASEGNATLSVVDLRTMRVVSRHRVGADPDVLAYDPGWRRLYVAAESGPLAVFEVRGDSVVRIGSVTAPNAHTVSVSPATHVVYLALRNVGGRAVLRIMDGIR